MVKIGVYYKKNEYVYKVAVANLVELTEEKKNQILSSVGLLDEAENVSWVVEGYVDENN